MPPYIRQCMVMKEIDRYRWGLLGRKSPSREKLASSKRGCVLNSKSTSHASMHALRCQELTPCLPLVLPLSSALVLTHSAGKGLRGKLHGWLNTHSLLFFSLSLRIWSFVRVISYHALCIPPDAMRPAPHHPCLAFLLLCGKKLRIYCLYTWRFANCKKLFLRIKLCSG